MDDDSKPTALDPADLPERTGSSYPAAFQAPVAGRRKRVLGDALGLTQFGVNLVVLEPGAWSAQRHWHSAEDEFVYVVEGELALVTDQGEHTLRAGMVAGFPASRADGHHLVNRSDRSASYLEIGTRVPDDRVVYPDIDLLLEPCPGGRVFTNRRGEDY